MADEYGGGDGYDTETYVPPQSYALSGRVMVFPIIVLFFVVVIMISLHLYTRCYLLRRHLRRLNRRTHFVLYADIPAPSVSRGLDPSVLKSLPVFTFSSSDDDEDSKIGGGEAPPECAVCLSEFEDGETARLLPKCKHSFHVDCIDVWFHSHSTCPLCRSPVEPVREEFVAIAVPGLDRAEAGTSLGMSSSCHHEEAPWTAADSFSSAEAPPLSGRRKPPAASRMRSPMSRMLSFTRILSRERWRSISPSSAAAAAATSSASCGTPTSEVDVERGSSTVGLGRAETR